MEAIRLRPASPDDYDTLGDLMFDAIHNGPTQYTKAQSEAWAPAPRAGSEWATRLAGKDIILAVRGDSILGFMSIEPGGYIDFAYIRPEAQGTGLFRTLFNEILSRAKTAAETELSTHASLMAQPAFAAMGFDVDHHETVEVNGESLSRARMTKSL